MADDMRKICLSIAVANSVPGKYLSAAINEAKHIHHWAKAMGYQSTLLTDESGDLTLAQVREAIEDALWPQKTDANGDPVAAPDTDRLILYFAGHGLLREAGEGLWLLSDWKDELRGVGVEPLKRRLFRYPVKQVTLIGDACLDLPATIDQAELVADPVLGNGPAERREPAIDRFIATQDGTTTFMVPGADPEDDRCIFSGVLLEGLWGLDPSAFSRFRQTEVTSGSLSDYLRAEVPKMSRRYAGERDPSTTSSFREGEDVYFSSTAGLTAPTFPEWPDPSTVLGMGAGRSTVEPVADAPPVRRMRSMWPPLNTTEFIRERTRDIRSIVRKSAPQAPKAATPTQPSLSTLIEQLGAARPAALFLPGEYGIIGGGGLGANGAEIGALWLSPDFVLNRDGPWWSILPVDRQYPYLVRPVPVLIENTRGQVAATVVLPKMETRVSFESSGAASLMMGSTSFPTTSGPTRNAIEAMERGSLGTNELYDLAAQLRQFKHVDPVLGVISAYLYDVEGDVESIRRMAYFYVEHQQPIPYDIAFLGLLRGWREDDVLRVEVPAVPERNPLNDAERQYEWTHCATRTVTGMVGGDWPWMRQGWSFLDDPTGDEMTLIVPELIEVLPHLGKGRFTTLDRDGAQILANRFGLVRHAQ